MPKISEENPCEVCGSTETDQAEGMLIHGKCQSCSRRVAKAMSCDERVSDHEMNRYYER